MELLRALKEISAEGLLTTHHNAGICGRVHRKDSHGTNYLIYKLGYDSDYPIDVETNTTPAEQYEAIFFNNNPEYNNDYLAARWYLLHEMINELELQ